MSYRFCSLVLTLMLCGVTGAADNPPEVEAALGSARLHDAEASAKTAQMERARAKGLIAGDSWAPILEPSPIDATRYSIRLFLDFDREVVSGSVEVEFTAVQPDVSRVDLDAWSGLRVLGVTLLEDPAYAFDSPVDLQFDHEDDLLSIDLPRALAEDESLRILISYGGRAGHRGYGINWDHHGAGGRVAWTMAEPFGARVWWPCNDRPDDKAVVDVTVTAPSEYTVASNGLMESTVDHGDGMTTTSWASIYPVASYLVVMDVADYVYSEETYVSDQGTTMPVALYAFPEVADQAEDDLANTPTMIEKMAEHFGEYPFIEEKYGNCTANFGGGMEHQTLTTLSAAAIGSDWMPWLNVHELGHQWWGDWITCADWRELWLNEGFATLTEWLWAEHLGEGTLQNYLASSDDIGLFLGPVYDNPVPFSGTVYDKGAWVLRMLRHRLGDEDFFEGVAAYRQAHAGEAATSEDLKAAFETVSGRDLEQFFHQWVYGKNRPRFRYSWETINGPAVRLVIEQIQQNAGLFEMLLDVRVTTAAGTEDHQIELAALAEQTIDITLNAAATGVELDPDRWNLFLSAPSDQPDLDLGPGYPGPFDAGQSFPGSPAALTIPITNAGGSSLEILDWGLAWGGSEFSITAPTQLPFTLAPDATVDLEIEFRSGGLNTRSNWLWIFSDDPDNSGFTYARLEGHGGIFPGDFLQASSSLNFGNVPVQGLDEATVEFSNLGGEAVTLSATIEGAEFTLLSEVPPVLEPGTRQTFLVRFAPEVVGDHQGSLVFETSSATWPTVEITLRGTGTSAPHLLVTPSSLALGLVDNDSQEGLIRISNDGTEDLNLLEFVFEGPFERPQGSADSIAIPPGEYQDLPVVSTTGQTGPVEGTLRIRSNDPTLPWATIPLTAVWVDEPILEEDRLAIPAAASTAGLGGAWWSTNLVLLNTGETGTVADLVFSPPGTQTNTNVDRTVTIPARAQRTVSDVVAALGHRGAGGMTVTTTEPELILTTRTAAVSQGQTFGQTIGPVRFGDAQTGQTSSVLSGLASGDGFHTNLGLYNLSDHPITVTFEVFAADGTLLGPINLSAAARAFAQKVDALSNLGAGDLRGAWAMLSSPEDGDLFTCYASVVDDLSHDPTFIPATLVDQGAGHLVIPTVAAQPGFSGTRWATELTLVNPSDIEVQATLVYHPADGSSTTGIDRLIPEGAALHVEDLLRDLFGVEGAGWLEIEASQGLIAGCRIFNDAADGTFGQFVPALPMPSEGPEGALIIPGLRSDRGFRTNLGLTSMSEVNTTVEVTMYSGEGVSLGTESVPLAAGAFVQLVKVLDQTFGFEGSAWAEIVASDTEVVFTAHASVVDGSTGDPSYMPASERFID
ncbi:MAG: M1 family aminopeptidase [Acidobacteriota bacterium]